MTATIIVVTDKTVELAQARLRNLPMDGSWEMVLREKTTARTPTQNAKMWADLLDTIADQAFVEGRKFHRDVWHEYLKGRFLPEADDPEIERKVREGYRKWDIDPGGNKVLIGSTTKLTTYGMREYMTEVEAYAATELGVRFFVREERSGESK